jgi:hypothetical protein
MVERTKTLNISIPDLCSKTIQRWLAGHGFPRFKSLRARLPLVLRGYCHVAGMSAEMQRQLRV